jgi:hypothetical protein
MKAPIYFLCLTAFLIFITSLDAQSQSSRRLKHPKWVSDKGFWQIESNIHTPHKNIIYFYNNENVMVYKENVDGVILDLNKKRVKIRLRKALESAVLAWNKNQVIPKDRQLVTMLFKK